jgi:hypothetical protein
MREDTGVHERLLLTLVLLWPVGAVNCQLGQRRERWAESVRNQLRRWSLSRLRITALFLAGLCLSGGAHGAADKVRRLECTAITQYSCASEGCNNADSSFQINIDF